MSFQEILDKFAKGFSQIFTGLPSNIGTILASPMTIITLIGLAVIILVLLKAVKTKFDVRMITTIAIALALSVVLSLFKIYQLPQGGSVTLASMVPILLVAYIYGPGVGMLTGFIYGLLTLLINPYILQPVQVLFDYPLPFLCLGIAGFLRTKKLQRSLGAAIAIFLAFVCHVVSGVAFYASYAPAGMSPLVYSIVYNGAYMLPDAIICIIVLYFLPVDRIIRVINKPTMNRKTT